MTKAPKSIKTFLLQLKALSEETIVSDLKGAGKLSEKEQSYLRGIIAGLQNDLCELPEEIWREFDVEPYQG